jgi:asparagine synthetase B (glutamine-hydrolysing)
MYKSGTEPLVLLSELQGQYAFVLYDGDRRNIFLARDSSGEEPLYYEIEDNGGINVSNSQVEVPAEVGQVHWSMLPPGHYISGKTPKVQQFALTPKQLSIREFYETLEDELSLSPKADGSSGKRSLSDELAEVTIE